MWAYVRGNPAHPGEVGEGGEYISRKEVPAERADESVEEKLLAGDASTCSHTGILSLMEGVK